MVLQGGNLTPMQWSYRLHQMVTSQGNCELVFPLPTAFQVASPELADGSYRWVSDPGVTFSGRGCSPMRVDFYLNLQGFVIFLS